MMQSLNAHELPAISPANQGGEEDAMDEELGNFESEEAENASGSHTVLDSNHMSDDMTQSVYAHELPAIASANHEEEESSLEEQLGNVEREEAPGTDVVRYEIVERGSTKGKDMLLDSQGYRYGKMRQRNGRTDWRCCVRNKHTTCRATVTQAHGSFTQGRHQHCHAPVPGQRSATYLIKEVKLSALGDVFRPAAAVTEQCLVALDLTATEAIPSIVNIARAANYHRRLNRPREPSDLEFEMINHFIPEGFMQSDLHSRDNRARHIVLATSRMLVLLQNAKTWYIDATFKCVRAPFHQLLAIHAFVKREGQLKQVPLCFVLMSRRRKSDYRQVLLSIKEDLLANCLVSSIVSDFEAALWHATRTVWAGRVTHRGCSFHWAQAVWRQIQELGLARQYRHNGDVHRFCRKLMALPYLPAEHIRSAFERLERKADSEVLQDLTTYIRRTWICSTIWPPAAWSCFQRKIRSNNDCEGWHARLNSRAGAGNLGLYKLAEILYKEAKIVDFSVRLLSEKKMLRLQRKSTVRHDQLLHEYWASYLAGERSVNRLLKACAQLYAHAKDN